MKMGSARNQISVVLLFVLHVSIDASPLGRAFCPDDFSPCTCTVKDNGAIYVNCIGLYGAEIHSALSKAPSVAHLDKLFIELPSDCGNFPADMLNGKSATWIEIYGPSPCELIVDPDAFQSTRNRTEEFWLESLSLQSFDFEFLQDFSVLNRLNLAYCSNIGQIEYLPDLPSLSALTVNQCSGSENLTAFPAGLSFGQLVETNWIAGDLTDAAAEALFGAITQSASVSTLRSVNLITNRLTQMPRALSLFENLEFLELSFNDIRNLKTGSLLFHVKPPQTLQLGSNPLTFIEPSAFVGDFSNLHVLDLSETAMTRFPADVFLSVLEDMTHRGYGGIQLGFKNQFVCDCEMAWLARDNRHLLSRIASGYCTDGQSFKDLDPADYATC